LVSAVLPPRRRPRRSNRPARRRQLQHRRSPSCFSLNCDWGVFNTAGMRFKTNEIQFMSWSIPILRVAGIQLRIHVTFVLLIAWIAFAYYSQGGSPAAVGGVLLVLLLFA